MTITRKDNKTMKEELSQMSRVSPDSEWLNKEPEPILCEYCGQLRRAKRYTFGARVCWDPEGPERCTCAEAVAAYEKEIAALKMHSLVNMLINDSGMGARFLRRTFETFQVTAENERAFRACKSYAEHFNDKLPDNAADPGRNGLFITGPKGTGKTHLAAAIANKLLREGTGVICMTMIDLLTEIKRTYESQWKGDAEHDLLTTYTKVPLLILDDVGKEPPTEWAVSKLYTIINARYEAYMPTIITTNYTDTELVRRFTPKDTGDRVTADATIDRLREMCAAIVTTGESWRSK